MGRSRGTSAGRAAGLWRYAATAVLGFSRRQEPLRAPTPWRDGTTSSYEAPIAADDPLSLSRAAQLPPFGRGNGVEALFWTPVARLADDQVERVLTALAADDIAAWVAPVRTRPRSTPPPAAAPQDLWVASLRLEAAQDVLMRVLTAGT